MALEIVLAAALAINGTIGLPQPHYCLRLVREIVEYAHGWPSGHLYELYWTHRVEENTTSEPWARDMERSLREAGYQVEHPVAGDIVFNHRVAWPFGHVGIMVSDILVLDVWPNALGPPVRLTPVWEWEPTTVIRFPPRGNDEEEITTDRE